MKTKWNYHKERSFASSYFIFWKFCFSLRTSYKELIYFTSKPNAHICAFCKRWSFIFDGAFSLWVSLNESFLWAVTRKNEIKLRKTEKTWERKMTPMKVTEWKWDTRLKLFEAFSIWTKNKHRIYYSSSSHDEEVSAKVTRISNSE